MEDWTGNPPLSVISPCKTSAIPETQRRRRRPAPGRPSANVEYSRRKRTPKRRLIVAVKTTKPRKNETSLTLSRY